MTKMKAPIAPTKSWPQSGFEELDDHISSYGVRIHAA
jgi:hypothetical protein